MRRALCHTAEAGNLTTMKAEILSIGTEILLGEIIDTNAAYIASRLPALGIDIYYKHVVGDNQDRLIGDDCAGARAVGRGHLHRRPGADAGRPHARGDLAP